MLFRKSSITTQIPKTPIMKNEMLIILLFPLIDGNPVNAIYKQNADISKGYMYNISFFMFL